MPDLAEAQLLWEDEKRNLTLEVSPSPSAGFVALLERTRFGTAGLRYRRLDVAGQLAALHQEGQFALVVQDLPRHLAAQDVGNRRIGLVKDHHVVGNFVAQFLDVGDVVATDTHNF